MALERRGPSASTPGRPIPGLSAADAVLYQAARAHAQEGRSAEAIASLRQIVRQKPDLADLWSELGALYSSVGESEHAVGSYRQVVRIRPADARGWYNLGALLQNLGQTADAIPAFRESLRLDPAMALAWHGLGSAQRSQGQHREAMFAHQQAVRFDSELAPAWYWLGNLHEHYEEYTEAIRAYREAVRARRYYPVAWYSLAVLCREEGQLPEAVSAFLECLRLRPHDTDAWVGLGITYSKQRNREGVLDVYQELAILDPEVAESFGTQYVENWTPAPQTPRRFPVRAPSRFGGRGAGSTGIHPLADTWYEMAVIHRRQGEAAEAISDFQEAVRFDPDHAKAWFSLAMLQRGQGRLDEALHALREVLRLKPRLAVAWHQIAQIHSGRGQHEKALKAYRKVLQLKPKDLAALCGLGRACIILDYTAGLTQVMETLRTLSPDLAEGLAREYAMAIDPDAVDSMPPLERHPRPSSSPHLHRAEEPATEGERVAQASFGVWLSSLRRSAEMRESSRLPLAPTHPHRG